MKFSLQLFNPGLFEVQKIKVKEEYASEFEIFAGKFFRVAGDIEITEVNRVKDYYRLLLRGVPGSETIIEVAVGDDLGFLYKIKTINKDIAIVEIYVIKQK